MSKLSVTGFKFASVFEDTLSLPLRRILYSTGQIEYNIRIHRCFPTAQIFLTLMGYEID